jgi:hypothetical protein
VRETITRDVGWHFALKSNAAWTELLDSVAYSSRIFKSNLKLSCEGIILEKSGKPKNPTTQEENIQGVPVSVPGSVQLYLLHQTLQQQLCSYSRQVCL